MEKTCRRKAEKQKLAEHRKRSESEGNDPKRNDGSKKNSIK